MPNHVTNRLVFTGSVDDVSALKQLMVVEDKQAVVASLATTGSDVGPFLTFDFSGIIPRPPILDRVISPPRKGEAGRFMLVGESERGYASREATPEEQAEIDASGYTDWYAWSIENWGTKWNSYSFNEVDNQARYECTFDTAWSAPNPILDKLAERFPNVSIDVAWFDEGWCHGGRGVMGRDGESESSESLYVEPDDALYEQVYGARPISEEELDRECAVDFTTVTELRIADNFTCNDVLSVSDEHGYYPIEAVIHHDDPDMTDDELFTIHQVRDRIIARLGL